MSQHNTPRLGNIIAAHIDAHREVIRAERAASGEQGEMYLSPYREAYGPIAPFTPYRRFRSHTKTVRISLADVTSARLALATTIIDSVK